MDNLAQDVQAQLSKKLIDHFTRVMIDELEQDEEAQSPANAESSD
jgi:hypothetical protein